jgi:hypothetical protein
MLDRNRTEPRDVIDRLCESKRHTVKKHPILMKDSLFTYDQVKAKPEPTTTSE